MSSSDNSHTTAAAAVSPQEFSNKVAFVTGASSGIGRATALEFARKGCNVVVADISEAGVRETAGLVDKEVGDGRSLAVRCDVTQAKDIQAALKQTIETFGRLDFAFNNAGVEPKTIVPIAELEEDEWNRIMDVDLKGVFLCMKYEIPLMLKHAGDGGGGGGAAIVNTSSGAGVIGVKNNAAYTAAKHGVIGLTRATALEYAAKGIRVNAVCPGYIDTPMIERYAGQSEEARAKVISEEPIGRMGMVEEIAGTVTWMCSKAAGFMVGHALVVDGGQTIV